MRKEVEELDFGFGAIEDAASPRDKNVRGKKSDSPLGRHDDALQPTDVEMKLDRVFDEIPPNSKERAQFEDLFLEDMARTLGVPRHLLQVPPFKMPNAMLFERDSTACHPQFVCSPSPR